VAKAEPGRLRIIGGRWRGRRLPVADQPGLRPTPDRVRETLFNWLTPCIAGSRCLDCFAGSGALGLEAASRGAAEVVMIERSQPVVRVLQANVADLAGADPTESLIEVIHADALDWLARTPPVAFDICFLDPPFAAGLLGDAAGLLATRAWLAPSALVYLEAARGDGLTGLPAGWSLIRDKNAGQVRYALAEIPNSASGAETS
jgi:16S rRNA (guanine966-N2)-methyltransferase